MQKKKNTFLGFWKIGKMAIDNTCSLNGDTIAIPLNKVQCDSYTVLPIGMNTM